MIRSLTLDAKPRGKFKPSTTAEKEFYRQLRKVAQTAGHIIERHANGARIIDEHLMTTELARYAKQLEPWAVRQARRMLERVSNSNKQAYQRNSKTVGRLIRSTVVESDVGETARQLLNDQVELIKSIPLEAGLRAQKIAFEAATLGTRATPDETVIEDLIEQMDFSTSAAITRATLIARTEVAKANAFINQARAEAVGSSQYRWRNSGDGAVRDSHKRWKGKLLDGRVFNWDSPPTLDDGMTGHPGTFPNCRCFAEPLF